MTKLFNKKGAFEWNGQEIAQYYTVCPVSALSACQSEENELYAIVFSREEGFYLKPFDLGKSY